MTKKIDITLVITNWNGAGFIARCLDTVFAQTRAPSAVVVGISIEDTFVEIGLKS